MNSSTPLSSSLTPFFSPRAVAVIGASRQRGTIGAEVFHNILSYGYTGMVYPVNTAGGEVGGVPAFRSIEEIPEPVDLAVIVVPGRFVLSVAESCQRKGVPALVVISAGFGESGPEGRERERELVNFCRAHEMRLIGPNCMGIANTDPAVKLHATFAPMTPPRGSIGFLTQSGALGLAIIDHATALNVGISTFVSYGNKADVSGNDLLAYWENDPNTNVILMYLESFGNPRKFSTLARRIGRTKPIVAVKSGRTTAGARATSSHTGALIATSDVTVDALFRQCGVIRTDSLEELFEVATFLTSQPVPKGNRVAIITNAGGPGIMCADACEATDLVVPELTPETQAHLREFLPAEASVRNPVDMIASASAEHYARTLEIVAADPGIDAVVVIFIPPLVTKSEAVAEKTMEVAKKIHGKKPVVGVFMSSHGLPPQLTTAEVRVPAYKFPESAARVLHHGVNYHRWLNAGEEAPPAFGDTDLDAAREVVHGAMERGAGWLDPREVATLLTSFRIPLVSQAIVTNAGEVGAASSQRGGLVAIKAYGPALLHKSDLGAVALNIPGGDDASAAARRIEQSLGEKGIRPDGFVIQPMAKPGVELIVGVVTDPLFGPVIACGAGGTMVELVRDVQVRLAPLTPRVASEMIQSLRTYPLLNGYRGKPRCDVKSVEDLLLRLSALVEAVPEIAELDLNPVIVTEAGASIVDARVRVGEVARVGRR